MDIFPGKSKRVGRLAFRLTFMSVLNMLNISFLRSIILLLILLPVLGSQIRYPMIIVVLFMCMLLLVGYFSFYRSSRLKLYPAMQEDLIRPKLKEYFGSDWRIVKNNKHYFYAEKSYGRLEHYFYAIFDKKGTYIAVIYDYPLPFCNYWESTEINYVSTMLEQTCNKKRNVMDGSDEPPIR